VPISADPSPDPDKYVNFPDLEAGETFLDGIVTLLFHCRMNWILLPGRQLEK
jgi:hypothetical protein